MNKCINGTNLQAENKGVKRTGNDQEIKQRPVEGDIHVKRLHRMNKSTKWIQGKQWHKRCEGGITCIMMSSINDR